MIVPREMAKEIEESFLEYLDKRIDEINRIGNIKLQLRKYDSRWDIDFCYPEDYDPKTRKCREYRGTLVRNVTSRKELLHELDVIENVLQAEKRIGRRIM